ncbi:MAG: hypothetical protein LBR45_00665 [Bacteroidales bacterium]|jgi:hypothetical protein|nr:hypothetical protein [Bacteroidales bacterium]
MDTLKEYIKAHRDVLEQEEPAMRHYERFKKKQHRKQVVGWWSIAAAVAGIFAIAAITSVYLQQNLRQPFDSTINCENAADMKACYIGRMQEVAANIDSLSKNLDLITRSDLHTEVFYIIEENETFDEELPKELPAEQTKKILAAYYSDNLNSLLEIEQRLSNLN